jgi:hypothetical protein
VITEVEVDRWAQAVVVANTPSSLLEWLQRDVTVQRLAETASEDAMLDLLYPRLRQHPRTELATGVAYALLVAIGLRRRATGTLGDWPFAVNHLTWGPAMWDRLRRASTTNSAIMINATHPSVQAYGDRGADPVRLLDQHGNPVVTQQ